MLLEIPPKNIIFKVPVKAFGGKDSTFTRRLGSIAKTAAAVTPVSIIAGCY